MHHEVVGGGVGETGKDFGIVSQHVEVDIGQEPDAVTEFTKILIKS